MSLSPESTHGKLVLVSAGIGDDDNITLKGLKAIQNADLILAMPFVERQLQKHLPRGIPILDAGHGLFSSLGRRGDNQLKTKYQEDQIRHRIREAIAKGLSVVVVEFGDPTLFGPQSGYLTEFRDLKPTVIPGISSFNAANALLGQSLLHDTQQRLLMTTAHGLADYKGTLPDILVLFTMQLEIPQLSQLLLSLYPGETPVVLIFHAGFSANQKRIHLQLNALANISNRLDIPWECMIYVGAIDDI